MKAFIREPLVHFLLIGTALFLLFELFDDPAGPQSSRIIISAGQVEFLQASYARTRQRTPSAEELQGLIDGYVREEILYREALALGLDKNDPVIRSRLRQKLELMSDDLAGIVIPTDDQLQQYLKSNAQRFTPEPQIAFRHIFIDVSKRGLSADAEAEIIVASLSAVGLGSNPDILGDSLMLPATFNLTPVSEITKLFGQPFSQKLLTLTPGEWSGPIQSGYGLHIVLVTNHAVGSLPALDKIRKVVEWEFRAANQRKLKENIYKELREKYTIVLEQQKGNDKTLQPIASAQAAQGDE